ncbi:S1 family peptidase [Streptomyces sp. ST2-7A]|uniref:S1 family peptidase n=1 Tax=Streptomyces sp. ST2-7A TaxID=2907214 RepID=UPI001F1619FF|nr:S1 family peptidase [Streptomyces sp. ST2-7A]MCE7081643.1 S1 family peptidase [Streptomyces sp. ST2-7A]
MRRNRRIAIGSVLAATALALTTMPAMASEETTLAERAEKAAAELPEGMLEAMQRDLGLSADEAKVRIVEELDAAVLDEELSADLDGYAGSWLAEGTTDLVVATSDSAEAAEIRAAGAEAKVVEHSLAELESVKELLDEAAEVNPTDNAPLWYVDVPTNKVVVHASDTTAAADWAEANGVDASALEIVESDEQPQTFYDLIGGDAYYIGSGRCSVGFSVRRGTTPGFVTAGHCGRVGNATTGYNRVSQGTFQGSVFPSRDMAWVSVNSNWIPTSWVRTSNTTGVRVTGSTQQPVGSSICRSGSTTGWRCGTIQQHNTSVTYPQGTVSGLTRTSACAEPGDSGGSFISGSQAQGVTSGGSGNCRTGGTTYHQPVNPMLSQWGLTLVTN